MFALTPPLLISLTLGGVSIKEEVKQGSLIGDKPAVGGQT